MFCSLLKKIATHHPQHHQMTTSILFRQFFWSRRKKPPAAPTFSLVSPQTVSPQLDPSSVPSHVSLPPYYKTGEPGPGPNRPEVKTAEAIQKMRASCSLARRILTEALRLAKVPGTPTNHIDQLVTQLSFEAGAYPSPLNYKGFPKSVCTSVNNVACHGIPDSRLLEDGDIVNVDVTVYLGGYHGDCSETVLVGQQDPGGSSARLLEVGRRALEVGIDQCGPGRRFCDIGGAVQKYVREQGYNVVPAFTGHGIGDYFHGPPDIICCRNSYPGVMLPGMTFTVEPIVSEGGAGVRILEDGWTAVSSDNSRSVQFEHTVLVTDTGLDILTSSSVGSS